MNARREDRLRYPDAPEPLPSPVVDNHCHLDFPVFGGGAGSGGDDTGGGAGSGGDDTGGGAGSGGDDTGGGAGSGGDDTGPAFRDPREAIDAAKAVGVARIVQVGCDLPSSAWAVEAASTFPELVAAVALHPNDAARMDAEQGRAALDAALDEIGRLAASGPRVRAVGETGLDYFRTGPEGREAQHHSFRRHVRLAHELGKTLVIHDRDAHDDVLAVLDDEGVPDRFVMHCFSGDAAFAQQCLDRGGYLSFAGTVTFKNAPNLREALALAPLDRVLVETDAPFLTPEPHRGRPNASFLIPLTVRFMAGIVGIPVDDLCRAIDSNTDAAFGGHWE